MHVAACERYRRIRLGLMGLLVVLTALAGYHWGTAFDQGPLRLEQHDVLIFAITFTVLAALVAIGIELAVTRTEMEAAAAQSQKESRKLQLSISGRHARELNQIVDRLSEDNSRLRQQLLNTRVHQAS